MLLLQNSITFLVNHVLKEHDEMTVNTVTAARADRSHSL